MGFAVTVVLVSDSQMLPLHKKWSFALEISSVNVTKSTGNCEFGHIYWRNLNGKLLHSVH